MDTDTEPLAGTRPCPLCEQRVLPGDPVVFSQTAIIHLNCYLKRDSVIESIVDVLRRHAGGEHCHRCLATLLHSTDDHIVGAVAALHMTRGYRITPIATCAVCGKAWTTVRAEVAQ